MSTNTSAQGSLAGFDGTTRSPSDCLRRTLRFCTLFLPHIAAAPLTLFLVATFLHELAHAAMALVLGGEVTALSFLPDETNLGHMSWTPPPGAGFVESGLVSIAPYLMWSGLALATILFAGLPNRVHWLTASTLFVWGYVIPVGDIAWNLASSSGDLAFPGLDGLAVHSLGLMGLTIAYPIGFWVQRRLFRENSVTPLGYLISTLVLGCSFGVAGLVGLTLFS